MTDNMGGGYVEDQATTSVNVDSSQVTVLQTSIIQSMLSQ
jgi:hypothetical protein